MLEMKVNDVISVANFLLSISMFLSAVSQNCTDTVGNMFRESLSSGIKLWPEKPEIIEG